MKTLMIVGIIISIIIFIVGISFGVYKLIATKNATTVPPPLKFTFHTAAPPVLSSATKSY